MAAQIVRRWRVQAYLDFMFMTKDLRFFLINAVSDVVLSLAGVASVFLLAERFDGIGVWTSPQILFMLGYAAFLTGLMDVGFGYNVLHISRRIGRGQFDHILVQPQPVWAAILTEGFTPFSSGLTLVTGTGIMVWACAGLDLTLSWTWCTWFGINVISSCLLVLAFSFLWGSLAFWSPLGAEEISSTANNLVAQLKSYPLDAVGPVLQKGLLTLLPVGYVTWFPSRALVGIGASPDLLWGTPMAAILFGLLALFAFRKGLAHYARTGSQRYVGWGHRG